ncbi:hypothetical protein CSQ88_20420 [Iodobacter sp. BJB302]|nr:hypothetical protein CSQ88_20420 [Iodobacter sp. BJB302]
MVVFVRSFKKESSKYAAYLQNICKLVLKMKYLSQSKMAGRSVIVKIVEMFLRFKRPVIPRLF